TVRVSYVLEAPVWKATYRILLNDEASGGQASGGQERPDRWHQGGDAPRSPLIKGSAVGDNTSDEDWQDVDLTLVAGLPVSFTHDLYTPRYIRRPVVEVRETTGVLPPMAEAGVEAVDSALMDFEMTLAPAAAAAAAPAPAKMRQRAVAASGGHGG